LRHLEALERRAAGLSHQPSMGRGPDKLLSMMDVAGEMLLGELAALAKRIASTSSRLEKVELVASMIRETDPEEAEKALLILTGRIFHPHDPRELNVSWATLWRVVESLTGDVEVEGADAGEMVESALRGRRIRQTPLLDEGLTVRRVYEMLEAMASAEGPGSRGRREEILRSLLSVCSPEEAWLLSNAIVGEPRLGLSEGLLIDAIARAYRIRRELVERAAMVMGDPYEIVASSGRLEFEPKVFRALRPMLAQSVGDVREALAELGRCSFEYKLDGARVQVHLRGDEVRIFSRRLADVTASIPDVVSSVREGLGVREAIVEGEVIAERDGRPLPFQVLMRRFRRVKVDPELIEEIPLVLYLFDALLIEGRSLLNEEYSHRRSLLERFAGEPLKLVPSIVTSSADEAESFLRSALEAGHEGVMAKKLSSPYVPGVRGRHWLKVKGSHTLDLVIVAAERGYGRRHRWYSDYYLAARDEGTNELLVVGKTFKGLTDEEFEWITRRLEELAIRRRGKLIEVRPEIVVEVEFNEVQRSPKYRSGYALRFARIRRIRDDKTPEDVDTLGRIREIYMRSRGESSDASSSSKDQL